MELQNDFEEVIQENSPLFQYLEQLGMPEVLQDLQQSPVVSVQPMETEIQLDETENKARGLMQATWRQFFNLGEENLAKKNLAIQHLLQSPRLLDEHHQYLSAFIESLCADENYENKGKASNAWCYLGLFGPVAVACLSAGMCLAKPQHHKFYIGAGAMTLCAISISKLPSYLRRKAACSLENKVKHLLQRISQVESLWKSFYTLYQEVKLTRLGSVIVCKDTQKYGKMQHDPTMGLRRAAYTFLCDCYQGLHTDALHFQSCLQQDMTFVSNYVIPSGDSVLEVTVLKEIYRHLQLLISQWITLFTLYLVNNSINNTLEMLDNVKGVSCHTDFENQLKFYKKVLDGQYERKNPIRSVKPLTGKEQAIYSLYLHSRELLQLTKTLNEGPDTNDELFNQIIQQLNDCKICLDLATKSQKVASLERSSATVESKHHEERFKPAQIQNEPITDQIFVTEADAVKDEPSAESIGEYADKLKREYEIFLMRELRGVVSELAKERATREMHLLNNSQLTADQLAQLTHGIILNRDIKALIQSNGQDQSEPESPPPEKLEKCVKYQPIEDCNVSHEVFPLDHMKQIASVVAARFEMTQVSEETFDCDGSD